MTAVCVPLPVGVGYCIEGRHDVVLDDRGRCPEHGTLCTWRSDRPRPPVVTETLARLLEASRLDADSRQGVHAQPMNVRQLRSVR